MCHHKTHFCSIMYTRMLPLDTRSFGDPFFSLIKIGQIFFFFKYLWEIVHTVGQEKWKNNMELDISHNEDKNPKMFKELSPHTNQNVAALPIQYLTNLKSGRCICLKSWGLRFMIRADYLCAFLWCSLGFRLDGCEYVPPIKLLSAEIKAACWCLHFHNNVNALHPVYKKNGIVQSLQLLWTVYVTGCGKNQARRSSDRLNSSADLRASPCQLMDPVGVCCLSTT